MIDMYSVLVVEDEPLELEFLKAIVEETLKSDVKVITAKNGRQAVNMAKKYRPDIIFMDVMLPEIDGIQAIREIRTFLSHVCVCIITAYMEFQFAQEAVRLHVHEYLLKPMKPSGIRNVLLDMVQKVEETQKIFAGEQTTLVKSEEKEEEKHPTFVEESKKYIQKHYKEKMTLEMVASEVYVNAQYFSRVFKKETGVTFTEYVNRLKIQYACKLLETTSYPAYRVSVECGFRDPSYFNRVFCAKMNMTPQKYKKQVMTKAKV